MVQHFEIFSYCNVFQWTDGTFTLFFFISFILYKFVFLLFLFIQISQVFVLDDSSVIKLIVTDHHLQQKLFYLGKFFIKNNNFPRWVVKQVMKNVRNEKISFPEQS